jgi:hypothetical protein
MPELTSEDYRDPIHLLPSGREKYSHRLAEVLAGELGSSSTR